MDRHTQAFNASMASVEISQRQQNTLPPDARIAIQMWRIVKHLWSFLNSFARLRKWKQNRSKGGVAMAGPYRIERRFRSGQWGITVSGCSLQGSIRSRIGP
ncbi:hypothetical protein EOE18_10310 [Novosphingobium umbonatum]|uniref:Uncharacterized protein n=1 Tax=Novosphingobium umbonatum TaxID=1908524 RepID=A0A437N5B9_9SPHN|nr:hypothetical protein [Novosphingobium umbonatum]RVU05110.1 hypothetical protein EOE18_10310 [Novosphingobium umbonatum]